MALKSAIYPDCMWAEAAHSAGYVYILCQAYSSSIGFLLEMYEKFLISLGDYGSVDRAETRLHWGVGTNFVLTKHQAVYEHEVCHRRNAIDQLIRKWRSPVVLRLSETTRSHVRKVLCQPELPMLLINENSDPDDVAAGGQDILAMTIIGRLFAHHGLMQTQRSVDILIAGFSNILCRP